MSKSKEKYILNVLRRGTITWSGRENCFRKNRTLMIIGTYKNKREKTKSFWKCEKCEMTSPDKNNFEVDHIKEIGGFKGSWDKIISVMYDENNLQLMCIDCHAKKTSKYNATRTYSRKVSVPDDSSEL